MGSPLMVTGVSRAKADRIVESGFDAGVVDDVLPGRDVYESKSAGA